MNPSHGSNGGKKKNYLYTWIGFQRQSRKALPGRYSTKRTMTQMEIDALDAIGFEWEAPDTDWSTARPDRFPEMLQQLKEYKKKHGHLNVPHVTECRDNALYNWIRKQPSSRKAMPNGHKGSRPMVQSEVDALDSIGFDWDPPVVTPREHPNTFWEKVAELKEFKAKHGHVDIRFNKNLSQSESSLYSWVSVQRKRHKALPNRHPNYSLMTQEETGALEGLGFVWDPPVVKRAYSSMFWERLEELKKYKVKHGHIHIRATDIEHKKLNDFVMTQRCRYNAYPGRYGHKSPMAFEDKEALDAVGFEVWTKKKEKKNNSVWAGKHLPS